jgi:nucleoside-diphosphate-sugar epimerase
VDARDLAAICVSLLKVPHGKGQRLVLSGGCISYQEFFSKIAEKKKIRKPVFETGPMLTGLAWRAAWVYSIISGKKPLLTRQTASSASKRFIYKGIAFREIMEDFSFRSITETLNWIIDKKS